LDGISLRSYFQDRIEKYDAPLIIKKDVGNYSSYSKICQSTTKRQPVILTDAELEKVNEEHNGFLRDEDVIKYGSDKNVFTINNAKNAKGYQVETFFILSEESTHKDPIRILFEDNDPDSINTPIAYQNSDAIVQFESNFEVEQNKNESYRMIRIMKPEFVQDILTNFKTIIAQ
jgi:hypothetical protein